MQTSTKDSPGIFLNSGQSGQKVRNIQTNGFFKTILVLNQQNLWQILEDYHIRQLQRVTEGTQSRKMTLQKT